MKFVVTSDWHIKKENPEYRVDNYLETALKKVQFIIDHANKNDARVLIAGDIFDSPRVGFYVLNRLMEILRTANEPPIVCYGNHDTTFHSADLTKTPYHNLLVSGTVVEGADLGDVVIHPVGWECTDVSPIENEVNILLGHIPTFESTVPFWSENGKTPTTLKRAFPGFDYYIVGDIHTPFVKKNVINPGSLLRSGIDQYDYEPRIYELCTDKGTINEVKIPIEPAASVFDTPKKTMADTRDVKALNEFIATLQSDQKEKPNFKNTLSSVVKQSEAPEPVVKIISDILEEVYGR